MPLDSLSAFHDAIRYGPRACPAELFAGDAAHVLRGLKVYANSVAHARRTALEDTYPRLLERIGAESFHAIATQFLDQDEVLSRSLDSLGEGFVLLLQMPTDRDLARAEWSWLQSFHAADADALTLAELAALSPEVLVQSRIALHPATALVELEAPTELSWGEGLDGSGPTLLITRPRTEVLLHRIDVRSSALADKLRQAAPCAELLDGDPTPLLPLIEAGAVLLEIPR